MNEIDPIHDDEEVECAHVEALSRILNIPENVLYLKVKDLPSIEGITPEGRRRIAYVIDDVIAVCKNILEIQGIAHEDGFFVNAGMRYGHKSAWSEELQINEITLKKRFKKIQFIYGKNSAGSCGKFYAEKDVVTVCADLLVPEHDENGMVTVGNITGICINPYAKIHNLYGAYLIKEIERAGIKSIAKAKNASGLPVDVFKIDEVESLDYVKTNKDRLVIKKSEKWNEKFKALETWLATHDNIYPLFSEIEGEERSLVIWIRGQRTAKRENKISEERIKKLEELQFEWEPFKSIWDRQYEAVSLFITTEKRIPSNEAEDPHEKKLGYWVRNQRNRFAKKPDDPGAQKLVNLGISLECYEESWQSFFKNLSDFLALHKRWPLSGAVDPIEAQLGTWIQHQRGAKRKNKLAAKRVVLLEALNISWDPHEADWEDNYQELQLYLQKNHCWPIKSKNKKLRNWIHTQRQNRKNNMLNPERVQKLNSLGIQWDLLESAWNEKFESVQKLVASGEWDNKDDKTKLVAWLNQQRDRYKKQKLDQERLNKLIAIGFTFEGKIKFAINLSQNIIRSQIEDLIDTDFDSSKL